MADNQSLTVASLASETPARTIPRVGFRFGLAILALAILSALVFYLAYTSQRSAVADFFIEWKGTQVALEGGNPYSLATTQQIQLGSKGRLVNPDEDQLAFVYPYWRVFFSAPIAFLDYQWASGIWLGLILSLYLASGHLVTLAAGWKRRSPVATSGLYLALIFTFPSFSSLMLGQSALLVAAMIGGIYYCLKANLQGWAGVLLALATVKPQLTLVLIPLLLVRAVWRKEWRFVAAFILTMAMLASLSFTLYPAWLSEFITAASRYPSYKPSLTGPGFIFAWLPGWIGSTLGWSLWAMIAAVGLLFWWNFTSTEPASTKPGLNYDLAFSLAVVLTLLLPPQTNISNPAILFIPFILLLNKLRGTAYGLLAGGSIVVSWVLYFLFFNSAYGVLIVLPPALIVLLLYLNFKDNLFPANAN